MDEEQVPQWAQLLISKVDGMQGSIDGLRTLLDSTCDRVTELELKS